MNKKQRIVLAIFVPIIIFFIALMIANSVGVTRFSKYGTHIHDPFDWEKTWYVWVFYLIFCCIFEYKLFADKNIPDNKKRRDKVNG